MFCNVIARAVNDENLNETLERVFRNIEESAKGSDAEINFAGLFDDFDVNSNKLGSTVARRNEKLVKFLNGVGKMNLGYLKDHSIDTFGDAYEYLMSMYASNAGKSGEEFYTPADVSELLTRLGTALTATGQSDVNAIYADENVWLSQKMMGLFYDVEAHTITYHLQKAFKDGELDKNSVTRNFRVTASGGKQYDTKHFNYKRRKVKASGYEKVY